MKAWIIDELRGLSHLKLADVDKPVPQNGEVLIKLHYAALNPADRYLAENQYPARPPLPHILGREGAGTIERLGIGVHNFQVGDIALVLRGDVGVNRWGTFAEYVTVPAHSLAPIPAGWSEPEAAAAPLTYITAYQALTQWGELPPKSVVLVTGASGGVGVACIHLAVAMGHRVLALSRGPARRDTLKAMGAEEAFDPTDADLPARIKDYLGDARVDLGIDNIGGDLLPQVIATLGNLGKVSLVGRLAGPVREFNTATLFFRRIRLGGVTVGAYTPDEARTAWHNAVTLLNKTGSKPVVDQIFPFDDLPMAFERLASEHFGKVLLEVQPNLR
jgi:NADPH:quinone reductase